MENNGYLAKVRLWLGHIIKVHIHATFEQDLLVIIKLSFK